MDPGGSNVSFSMPLFQWDDVDVQGTVSYQLQIDDQPDFSSPEIDVMTSESEFLTPPESALAPGDYFRRARAFNGGQPGDYSATRLWTVIEPAYQFIYFGGEASSETGASVRRIDRISREIEVLVDDVVAPRDVAVSLSLGKVYWTDVGDATIKRANLDGTGVETIVSGHTVEHLEIDDAAGRMFWTSGADLMSSDLSGGDVTTTVGPAGLASGLTLDRDSQQVYWSVAGAGVLTVGYDGSGQAAAISDPAWPETEIYFDAAIDKLYWYSPSETVRSFLRANPDGTEVEVIADQHMPVPVTRGLIIDESAGRLFWVWPSDSGGQIESVNRDGRDNGIAIGSQKSVVDLLPFPINGLALGPETVP
jgi:hypothetical protein